MPRKYILVCHYGSLPKNNLFSPYKSGLLKTQAPPPQKKIFVLEKTVLEVFLVFLVKNVLFPANQQFQKSLPS